MRAILAFPARGQAGLSSQSSLASPAGIGRRRPTFTGLAVGALLFVVFTTVIWPQLPSPASPASGASELTFSGRRGIGGIKTFQFPDERRDDPARFVDDPYVPHWREEMLSGRLEELKRAGFDFLRLNINPGPLFAAANPAEFAKRLAEIDFAVSASLHGGMKVVLDIHVSEAHPVWGSRQVTAGTDRPAFRRYLEAVTALAKIVAIYDPRLVALELFNEPPRPCVWLDRPGWPEQLAIVYARARQTAPHHTLIIAGACYADVDGLALLDTTTFDGNTMFSAHYYEPHIFTHQGSWASSDKFMRYISPLPYPADPALLPSILERIDQAIMQAPTIAPDARQTESSRAKRRVARYFSEFPTRGRVGEVFGRLRAWADWNKISPQRILIGEFGVMKDIYGYTGARPEDRARWFADVREAAEHNGFAWAAWALTNTMGIIEGQTEGPLDPVVLDALGLKQRE